MEDNTAAVVVQPQKTAERRYIRPRELMAYSLTGYGINNLTTFVGATNQFFMMSFLGLSGTLYGLMATISTVWDALDDPLSGVIIDRSRTRWGRLRPFLLLSMPFWSVTSILFYCVPGSLVSLQSKFVYALALTILNGIGHSYLGSWELLLYNITPNMNERGRLIATEKFLRLFTYLPSLVAVGVDFLPKATGNAVTQQSVYTGSSFVFVVIAVAFVLFGFFNMKERVAVMTGEEMKNVSIFRSFVSLIKCRPLLVVLLATFFSDVKGIGGSSEDFFWLNCTGKLSNRVLCSLFTGFPNYVTTPVTPVLVRKFGLRATAVGAGVFGGVTYTLLYLIGYNPFGGSGGSMKNFVYMVLGLTICGLPNHIMSVCDPLLKGDMYDYLEWSTGMRNEGIVNAVSGYVRKLSGSLIKMISGAVYDWIKFTQPKDAYGNAIPHTNPKVLKGIFGVFALAPAASRFGYALALLLFNVNGRFKERMLEELAVKRLARTKIEGIRDLVSGVWDL